MPRLPEIAYDHYYKWPEITEFLSAAQEQYSDTCALQQIGQTPEGRPILCARITAPGGDPDAKPAYVVKANVHAAEVAGATASLYLVRHLLSGSESDPSIQEMLKSIVFYIIPRLNPDGAEFILNTGGAIRSRNTPRYRKNGLYQEDVDGDGMILSMRIEDPCGSVRPHPTDPRHLIPREADDVEGPFYFVYEEGSIHDWDGGPISRAERSADFNHNWGANWQPEYEQPGAGDFPFSQPEMQAFARFVYAHPSIFGILGFHCGNNSVLRPPSTGSDDDIIAADLEKMKEIGLKGEEYTGFGLRAVVDYHLDGQKPIALRGHFHDWGYRHLGLHVFEIELGNIYNSLGTTTEDYFASTAQDRSDYYLEVFQWSDANPHKQAFVDWRPFDHPQLGPVEIGGWDRHYIANPLSEDMAQIAPKCALFILDHARRHPRLHIMKAAATHIDAAIYRVRATVMNTGDLPTQITQMGHRVTHNEPVRVCLQGAEVLSRGAVEQIGHLAGICGYRDMEWFVKAQPGTKLTISASTPKAGVATQRLEL